MTKPPVNRRRFLSTAAAAGGLLAAGAMLPAWARSARAQAQAGLGVLSGKTFDLVIDHAPLTIDGRKGKAVAINGTVPAPLLRWREGDRITLRVANRLAEDTSIHWHGILLPFQMDGVPGVTFPGIRPDETFVYEFTVRQAGTYWYHSHSGLQEQLGHYGPIIIDPAAPDPVTYDREYVIVLSDWTFMNPHRLFAELKKDGESLNYQKRTLKDFVADARADGLGAALKDRLMWGAMRMSPTDIADVTGATYSYLVNGHGPADNWTALFRPGERVRLRIINAAAMTLFNIRIPGLPMTVVQADGHNIVPVETDEFQMGVAETYDVIVAPQDDSAFTFMAEAIDRSGYGRATLAPRPGMDAAVPPLRPRPLLTMKDMGMANHGGHGGMDHGAMDHGGMDHGAMDHGGMDHGAMGHDAATHGNGAAARHAHPQGVGVASVAPSPVSRLHEPGIGLENVPHRTLDYARLRSLERNPDRRAPAREIEVHLTSNMERYMWSFDGVKFSQVVDPIVFHEGERVRLTMVNDTMMPHPIHLHGMFFDVVNGGGDHKPRKHTITVKPGEKLSVDVTADAVGDWAFHCHLLYHMHAGMMQVVSVRPRADGNDGQQHDPHRHHHMSQVL
ncbi:MAG: copper resistance system multicopper oxidase [Alphaproteobacteria bacterium]|nr:MAG: copper resistance system multicopper oxidase [Alphaproteobacteria bacterium]